ncbi:CLUMA_CG005811, isoform A [Clunio marinus]|uniref:CLUMA_CG005811, isoform A n=1 Tax=Clunio marinus TaxID=568069 RepID=A0A1J1I091_9DIPT|nr:CLUMA_CG005811, isoform A [Clunio marinus]
MQIHQVETRNKESTNSEKMSRFGCYLKSTRFVMLSKNLSFLLVTKRTARELKALVKTLNL